MELPKIINTKDLDKFPIDVLRKIGLEADWKTADRYCQLSKRFARLCKAGFWTDKYIYDFGSLGNYNTGFYKAPFPKYLVARANYLKEELDKINAPIMVNTYGKNLDELKETQNYILVTLPNGKEVKAEPHVRNLNNLVSRITRYYKRKGLPEISDWDRNKLYGYIQEYERRKLDKEDIENLRKYKEINNEIEEISDILAKYLKSKYPNNFRAIFTEDSYNIRQLTSIEENIKKAIPGYGVPDNLLINRDPYSKTFTPIGYVEAENKLILRITPNENGIEFPNLFHRNMDRAGLTINGIRKLYGLEKYPLAIENELVYMGRETPANTIAIKLPVNPTPYEEIPEDID
jgi:hypothetical protein